MIKQVTAVVNDDYDLGVVTAVDQIFGGYTNASFKVTMRGDGGECDYFVRKYNEAITEPEIRLEHALLDHIWERGFTLAPHAYRSRAGETFVKRIEAAGGRRVTRFFAVFDMLHGEDKYTWVQNRLTDRELASAARVLAHYHHAGADFDPQGLSREQPPIMQMVRGLPGQFREYAAASHGTIVDEYFLAHLDEIVENLKRGDFPPAALEGLPIVPVHCDYHPGNEKWIDEEVVGLFDFDWAKLDYRIFDVAEGVAYFCSCWEGANDGRLLLDKTALFVNAYQDAAAAWPDPGPMTESELAVLPRMIANANLYVLNWDVYAYYGIDAPDPDEYLVYFRHNIEVMAHIEAHMPELETLVRPALAR